MDKQTNMVRLTEQAHFIRWTNKQISSDRQSKHILSDGQTNKYGQIDRASTFHQMDKQTNMVR